MGEMTLTWRCWKLGLASLLAMGGAIADSGDYAKAQITPDGTLGNDSSIVLPNFNGSADEVLVGGAQEGANLFHSFQEFNVSEGRRAYFYSHSTDIQNVLARVTGGNPSKIMGVLGTYGESAPTLFLINPNGIIFGPNARLDVGGSFVASTARSVLFADGNQYSATASQTAPLLTISVPIGLQYGGSPGSILNQSRVYNYDVSSGRSVPGLTVQPGKTLALVGGNVSLDGGRLTVLGGRVELGGVASSGTVGLSGDGSLNYPAGVQRADVSLTNGAGVYVIGEDGGYIQVQGKRVTLSNSRIYSYSITPKPGKTVSVNASESVTIEDSSIYVGDSNGGQASDLTVTASELVELKNRGSLRNQSGGDLAIQARMLILSENAVVSTLTLDERGGNITITAPESVELIGSTEITSQTLGTGDAGDITIDTGKLVLIESGFEVPAIETLTISPQSLPYTQTASAESGKGGNLTINASESVEMSGGFLDASTYSRGAGGNLTIQTGKFIARNGAQVLAGTGGNGLGGILTINASESVEVSGKSADDWDQPSELSTSSGSAIGGRTVYLGNGDASDMKIETNELIVQNGGRISAATLGQGNGGNIDIQAGRLLVRDGAQVTVSSQGSGNAGNLEVAARSIRLDNQATLSSNTTAGQGNISLRSQDLVLRHGSNITTNASGTATGGNITINTGVIAALEDSDISANALESPGGRVRIDAQGIFGIEFRERENPATSDITATSELGTDFSGTEEINTPDIDPSRGLATLPAELVNVTRLIAQGCPGTRGNAGRGESEFIITGRGGLLPNPSEALRSDAVRVDSATPIQSQENRASAAVFTNSTRVSAPTAIVEAQGWVIGANGEVILTARPPTVTPYSPWLAAADCHTPQNSS